jgi:hypothetical protein
VLCLSSREVVGMTEVEGGDGICKQSAVASGRDAVRERLSIVVGDNATTMRSSSRISSVFK